MNGPGIRASDADRERTVVALQREVGTGRLTLDEFAERSAVVYDARTLGELAALTRDLPHPALAGGPSPRHARMPVLLAIAALLAVTLLAFTGLAALGAMGGVSGMPGFSCH